AARAKMRRVMAISLIVQLKPDGAGRHENVIWCTGGKRPPPRAGHAPFAVAADRSCQDASTRGPRARFSGHFCRANGPDRPPGLLCHTSTAELLRCASGHFHAPWDM